MDKSQPEKTTIALSSKAVFGTIYTFIGDYLVYFINFARGIILARLVAPEIFGIIALGEFFAGFVGQPTKMGFDQAVIEKDQELEGYYDNHFLLTNGAWLLSFLLLIVVTPVLTASYGIEVTLSTWVLLFVLLTTTLGATQTVYMRKNFRFGLLGGIQVARSVAAFIVSVWMALNGYQLWAILAVHLTFGGVGMVLSWVLSDWRPSFKFDKVKSKEMIKFGGTLWVGALFSFLVLQFDDFLVGQFAGLVVLGFYSKAYAMAQQPLALFSQVINKVLAPVIAEVRDDPERLARTFNLVIGLAFKGTLLLAVVLFLWAPETIELVIGARWLPMVPYFRILILYLLFQPIWDLVGSIFTFTGRPRIFVKGQILQALLLMTFGTILVFYIGATGAAIVISTVISTTTIIYLVKVQRLGIPIQWWSVFIVPGISALIAAVMSWYLIGTIATGSLTFWLLVILLPTSIYGLSMLVLERQSLIDDLNLVRSAIKKR